MMYANKTKTVLTVDEKKYYHDLYAEILKSSDCNIVSVYDGYEALSRIPEIKPDLIITDIRLNMMTGDMLFLVVKCMPEYKDIPFIMVSNVFLYSYEYLKEFDPNLVFINKKYLTKERLIEEIERMKQCCNIGTGERQYYQWFSDKAGIKNTYTPQFMKNVGVWIMKLLIT